MSAKHGHFLTRNGTETVAGEGWEKDIDVKGYGNGSVAVDVDVLPWNNFGCLHSCFISNCFSLKQIRYFHNFVISRWTLDI